MGHPGERRWPVWLCGLVGAAAFLLMTVPAVAVLTVVHGFPVPFHGMASGLGDVPVAIAGATFAGCVTGAYVGLAVVGATVGAFVSDRTPRRVAVTVVVAGLVADTAIAAAVAAAATFAG